MNQIHSRRSFTVGAAAAALSTVTRARDAHAVTLASPDKRVVFTVIAGDPLTYTVTIGDHQVIERSELGMIVDGANLSDGAEVSKTDHYKVDETYAWYGVTSIAVNRCNGLRVSLRHSGTGARYTLDMRAYNDGVAFQHVVPGPADKPRVPDESTSFRIPGGSTLWYHDFEGHYEGSHTKKAVEQVAAGEWAAPPLTIKLPNESGYASLTEGGLRAYAGMGLQADGKSGFNVRLGHAHPPSYPFRLRYGADEAKRLAQPAAVNGTITTPWRVVMIGSDLNALVNCGIVHHVAHPPDPKLFPRGIRTDWIRPGRAVWKYLDGGGENTVDTMKEFSRLASDLGFEYNVVEGFWSKWPEAELKEFIDYSRERGIDIVLWKHSRDLRDPAKRRAFFELCARNGAAGAKIDFFDHEAKEIVELYEACLRDAAEFKLIVDFHGANKPAGESRTWPNELTREAVRGMESRRTPRAQHDATLPFTRMLAGHADYTPMVFTERRNDTTWAHQIATAAIFTSPLLIYGAHPKSIIDNPAVEVIKSIPSIWDETIALPASEIGDIAAFARRRGDRWFIAVVNGPAAKTLAVPLTFIRSRRYKAVLIRDDLDRADAVRMENVVLGREDSVRIQMPAGGGFVAMLSPDAG
jgi:alpha-glucosidase